jgi:cell division protein FtsL
MHEKLKHLSIIVIAILLIAPMIQTAKTQTINSATDNALKLITEVLPLDKTKYAISLALYNKPSSTLADSATEEYVTYNLMNNNVEITTVRTSFRNSRLFTLIATAPPNSELVFSQPSKSSLDLAMEIMEGYQNFLEDTSLNDMLKVLGAIESVDNKTAYVGNIKLEITNDSYATSFYWKTVYNGVEYNEISIVFQQTRRILFGDMQSRYKMGSTEVTISEEQALETAIIYVKNHSYDVIGGIAENETKITVRDFKISLERTTVELSSAERNGLMYPFWTVKVALEELYPGNVYGFSVGIWADSGEVANLGTLAVGANPIDNASENRGTTDNLPIGDSKNQVSSQQSNSILTIETIISIATVMAVCVLAITVLALKKRRSK